MALEEHQITDTLDQISKTLGVPFFIHMVEPLGVDGQDIGCFVDFEHTGKTPGGFIMQVVETTLLHVKDRGSFSGPPKSRDWYVECARLAAQVAERFMTAAAEVDSGKESN